MRIGRQAHDPIEGEVERNERGQPLEGWKLMDNHNHAGSFMLYGGHLKLVVSIFLRIDTMNDPIDGHTIAKLMVKPGCGGCAGRTRNPRSD